MRNLTKPLRVIRTNTHITLPSLSTSWGYFMHRLKSTERPTFHPESMKETHDNMEVIKGLVTLVAKEIIDPKLGGLATKEDLTSLATKDALKDAKKELSEQIEKLATKDALNGLATKEDLTRLATKEDLTRLATKEELTRLATDLKTDIKSLATKESLEKLETNTEKALEKSETGLNDVKEELKSLSDKISQMSNEFYKAQRDSTRWLLGAGATTFVIVLAAQQLGLFNEKRAKAALQQEREAVQAKNSFAQGSEASSPPATNA